MNACQALLCAVATGVCTEAQVLDLGLTPQFTTWPTGPNVIPLETMIGGSPAPNSFGLAFDLSSQKLLLNFAWGGAYGLQDLAAPFTGASLEAGGSTYKSKGMVYDLTPHVYQQSPTCGGLFSLDLPLESIGSYTVAQQQEDLLKGRWFINIQSSTGPSGEIRGQLAPVPEPSTYGACIALGLLSFAVYRKARQPEVQTIPAQTVRR